jgi:uncharacterized protein (DUF697 family)
MARAMQRDAAGEKLMHANKFAAESLDEMELESIESGAGSSFEAGAEDMPFGETEEMELASRLLEITDENELDGFIGSLIARAAGGARRLAASPELRGLLRKAAKSALPMIGSAAGNVIAPGVGGAIGSKLAATAGNLFGLELEGLSPEDQEFEVARRFVRFAGAGARNAAGFRGGASRGHVARRALGAAARQHAPGFFRRRRRPSRPRPVRGGRVATAWLGYDPAPTPAAATCSCCGAAQPDAAPSSPADADNTLLPDNEPADSTDQQTQTPKGNDMHDLDRTTMELTDEADSFEFPETYEYGIQGEGNFSEDEVEELAATLLEISDEQELDQFLGSLFNKARRFVGGALKSPLLRPLGGLLKGAIKKALPIAGSALGNMVVPGIGGMVGSGLASGIGGMFGLELEALAPEDQEFEGAKRLVQMAGTAIQNAAQTPSTGDPQAAAKSAVIAAAQAHVPGLLQPKRGLNGAGRRPRSGRWYRRGGKIIVVGV